MAQTAVPLSTPMASSGCPCHIGVPDQIEQSRLLLSLGVADAVSFDLVAIVTTTSHATSDYGDATHSLAYMVLRLLVLSGVDIHTSGFRSSVDFI